MISVIKEKFGYDDALDAFGCHGVGGIWGGICTGIFAQTSINPDARWNGLLFGEIQLFGVQIASILISIAAAVVGTLICWGLTKLIIREPRVEQKEERLGLDRTQHDESAYPSFNGLD